MSGPIGGAGVVGTVTWSPTPGLPPLVATLDIDGTIAVSGSDAGVNEAYRRLLLRGYAASPRGPAEGRPGVAFLEDIASRLGGRAEVAPDPAPLPAGTVF